MLMNGHPGRTLKHCLSEHWQALQNDDVAASALAAPVWCTGHDDDLFLFSSYYRWKNVVRSGKDEFGYEPELVNVRERVAKFEDEFKRVGTLETEVGGLKPRVGTLETEVGGLKPRVGTLETEVGGLKPRVRTLETEVGGLKPRVGTLETQVEGMQNWAGRMDTWKRQVQTDVHELKTLQRNVESKVKELKTQPDRTKTDVEYLRKQFGSVERGFGEVKRQTAAFEMAAKTRMDGFEDRARERNAHVDGEIEHMKKKMVETEKKLEKVQQKVNATRPVVFNNATFNLPASADNNNKAKMQEMGSAFGSAMKSMLLASASDDDNAQDCITVSQK